MSKKVLILSTKNSSRSIITEALINAKLEGFSCDSAGVKASGEVNPNTKKLLEEKGIWRNEYHSKTLDKVINNSYELLVIVCNKTNDVYPLFPLETKIMHMNFENLEGKDFTTFEDVYEEIEVILLSKIKEEFGLF